MTEAEAAKIAAKKMLKMSTKAICDMFDITTEKMKTDKTDVEDVVLTREWIMLELERRNNTAFNVWMNSFINSPSQFFN